MIKKEDYIECEVDKRREIKDEIIFHRSKERTCLVIRYLPGEERYMVRFYKKDFTFILI